MQIKLEGVVTTDVQDTYENDRIGPTLEPYAIYIGETDLIRAIEHNGFYGEVTLAVADARFFGELEASGAWIGYSEYTPGMPCELKIGAHDLWPIFRNLETKHVTVWVADEPINVLE